MLPICIETCQQVTGNIMIDSLVFALAAIAMGIPAIITAATLGSKLEFDR
jgi:hypothetical protein